VTSTLPPFGEPLLTTAQLREVEAAHAKLDLMQRAGKAAADFLRARSTTDARVVLLVGPGNNGGDALACAAELAEMGYAPTVVLLGAPEKFGEDAARAWRRVEALMSGTVASHLPYGAGGRIVVAHHIPQTITADWIIDGLFGIGLKRPLDGAYRDAVRAIARARGTGAKVLSLDVPSGSDADTGALVGETVVAADFTLTFIANKPGLVTGPALDFVGELRCASLDTSPPDARTDTARLLNKAYLNATQKHAQANAHKGAHGTCIIIGGGAGMLGAALLSSRAAMRAGAGKVKLGWLAEPHPQVDPLMPEVMMGGAAELANGECSALVIGCGLGVTGAAVRILKSALKRDLPLVIDADALNLIAESADLATLVQRRAAPTVITPHPAEAARLLGCSTADVQRDRLRAAHDLAKGYACIAVVKGAGTVVCDGVMTTINSTGNPLLATAGTGDVLAGMVGALLAQGYDAAIAARLGVCMHGAAADALRARGVMRAVATDIIDELRFL
jgi:ADP-dependent NAD(P)H-hydrate dehydratase / NAD(P)H-hydrate epimerase